MRALIVGDVHYAQYSSIVRKRGEYYSKRLENLIWSINWAEKLAEEQRVDKVIYLGDFLDRADLNAEELTALKEIEWAKDIPHVLLVGNHEVASRSLEYSSIHLASILGDNFLVVDKPMGEVGFGYKFYYLPYIFENNREPLENYLTIGGDVETQELKQIFIFSHNDIKGVQYGLFESKSGFEKDEILATGCRYFINGHIHNQGWVVPDRILNLGNLTGQNFNEDGLRYPHTVAILDTRDYQQPLTLIKNPYAYQFLKLEVHSAQDIECLPDLTHMVLSVKCDEALVDDLRAALDNSENVEEYRIITTSQEADDEDGPTVQVFNSLDHLEQFQSYILEQLGKSEPVVKELEEVLK